jgi:hypothetical protein
LQLLQFQKVDGCTKERLFSAVIKTGQKNVQYFSLFRLLHIISFYPESPCLFHIGSSAPVCYERIKIINMIVFFTRVFTALETIFYTAMLHTAPCNFTRLVSFTADAAGAVFIQEHGAKPAIQPT